MDQQRAIDLLAVGGIDMDLVLTLPRLPGHDEKEVGHLVGRLPGGPGANCACAASRLGLRVASWCQVGDDENGQLIIEDFARYGVDTSRIEVVPGEETSFTIILIDPSGEKVIIVVPTFKPNYSPEIAAQALSQTRVMMMMPGDETQFLSLAQIAHAQGAEVMIDIEPSACSDRTALERLLTQTDIASFNQFGFAAAAGQPPSIEAAQALLDFGPHTVIVTLGRDGVLAVTRTEAATHPGFDVPVVDTTGAGDTFHAAYVSATLRGLPLDQRLRFAAATAALSVTALGPRGNLPTLAEVEAFLAEN